jgi:hypothetical protein
MLIAALVATAKIRNQSECPPEGKWIKKMWYIYTMKYYSAIKKNEILHLQQNGWTWRTLCDVKQSRHRKTSTAYSLSYVGT